MTKESTCWEGFRKCESNQTRKLVCLLADVESKKASPNMLSARSVLVNRAALACTLTRYTGDGRGPVPNGERRATSTYRQYLIYPAYLRSDAVSLSSRLSELTHGSLRSLLGIRLTVVQKVNGI